MDSTEHTVVELSFGNCACTIPKSCMVGLSIWGAYALHPDSPDVHALKMFPGWRLVKTRTVEGIMFSIRTGDVSAVVIGEEFEEWLKAEMGYWDQTFYAGPGDWNDPQLEMFIYPLTREDGSTVHTYVSHVAMTLESRIGFYSKPGQDDVLITMIDGTYDGNFHQIDYPFYIQQAALLRPV